MRKWQIILITSFALFFCSCQFKAETTGPAPETTPVPNEVNEAVESRTVTFPDNNLAASVRNALFVEGIRSHDEALAKKPLDEAITEADLAKHSDGALWPLFEQIVETGVDGIHPIDPEAGMDMGEAKAKYGHKVCLMGNIDCGLLLTWGSPDEVRQVTKECIRKGAKGGGLICMSSNSIHSGVKPENYLAMLETIREYGTYPLENHFQNLVEPGSGVWS